MDSRGGVIPVAVINVHEQEITDNYEGNYPYDRLAIIYKKRGQIVDLGKTWS